MPKVYQLLYLILICCFISCKKDLLTQSKGGEKIISVDGGLNSIKKQFASGKYDNQLTEKIRDTISIVWQPNWNSITEKTYGDSITCVYIPLNGERINTNSGKQLGFINTINTEKYLLYTLKKDSSYFSFATYINKSTTTLNKKNKPSINGESYINHTLQLKAFNGRLVLTNLKENKKTLVSYLNGKPYLPSNKNSIHTNTIKPSAWEEQNCRYYVTCTWVTEENPNCSPTYYSNTDGDDFCYEPDNTVGGCYYYWDLVSSVIDRQCDQVWVPDPPDNTGGGGQGGDSPPSNEQVVHTDSLAAHFPCAVKLILDKLAENGVYADFVQPFTTSQRPDLTWTNANLNWVPNGDSGNIKLGSTEVDKALNTVNRSASITLNTSMLQNSSQLMIAATAIHETLHAYINYQIITGGPTFTTPPDYDPNKPWLYSVDAYAYMFGLPSNFRDHWAMLDEYFDRSVQILKQFDNSAHLDNDYVMAMLYGLNNADGFLSMQGSLNDEYKKIMSRYKISQSQLDAFWNTQLYATSNKLPNDCP